MFRNRAHTPRSSSNLSHDPSSITALTLTVPHAELMFTGTTWLVEYQSSPGTGFGYVEQVGDESDEVFGVPLNQTTRACTQQQW